MNELDYLGLILKDLLYKLNVHKILTWCLFVHSPVRAIHCRQMGRFNNFITEMGPDKTSLDRVKCMTNKIQFMN